MVEYKEDYDRVIVNAIYRTDRLGEYSFTDIYNIVRQSKWGNPNVGKDTVQRHLNKLVEEDKVLVRLPKGGRRYNKTLYMISPAGLVWLDERKF